MKNKIGYILLLIFNQKCQRNDISLLFIYLLGSKARVLKLWDKGEKAKEALYKFRMNSSTDTSKIIQEER